MTGIWKKHKQTLKLAVISIIFNYIFGGLSNISHWYGVMTCLAFRGFDFGQTVKCSAFDSHQYKHHCQRGQIFAHSPGMFRLKNTMTLFGLYYFFFRRWEVNIRWLDAPAIKLRSSHFAARRRNGRRKPCDPRAVSRWAACVKSFGAATRTDWWDPARMRMCFARFVCEHDIKITNDIQ